MVMMEKAKKILCQPMNKQVPGRLKINSSLENKERKKDLENFSEAELKHPVIYLLIFKFT